MATVLRLVDPHTRRRTRVRRHLALALRDLARDPEIAGYALVTWDTRGATASAICAAFGPMALGIVPAVVKDQLNRHLASDMAEEAILGPPQDRGA